MGYVVIGSACASPGATTLTALVGASAEGACVVIEADEVGGVFVPRLGLAERPGALDLASVAATLDFDALWAHCQRVGTAAHGWSVLVAPGEPAQVTATYRQLAEPLAQLLGTEELVGIVDIGRATAASATWPLVAGADVVVLVARCRLCEFRPFAARARELAAHGAPVAAVLVAEGPYAPEEFAATAGVELLGVVPTDPRGAAVLRGEAVSARALARSPLWQAGRQLAGSVAARLGRTVPTPEPTQKEVVGT